MGYQKAKQQETQEKRGKQPAKGKPQGRNAPRDKGNHDADTEDRGERRRPDLRITVKQRDENDEDVFTNILAYWRDAKTGYFQGGIDKRVKMITVEMSDGSVLELAPGTVGEYVNAYERSE